MVTIPRRASRLLRVPAAHGGEFHGLGAAVNHLIQTDNGAEFQSRFHWHLESLDIQHVYIRPRTPHLNGKVERSHRVDEQEFYQLLDTAGISDDIHLFNAKLREWRTTTITIARTARWTARHPTSGSSPDES